MISVVFCIIYQDGKGGWLDSSVFDDYSTLERLDTPEKQVELHIRSADENTSELDYEDDMRYLTDDSAMKKVTFCLLAMLGVGCLESSVVGKTLDSCI